MNKIYPISLLSLSSLLFISTSQAQTTRIKTITIVNGDTTISEKVIPDPERTREIMITRSGEADSLRKSMEKIIIDGETREREAFAYAYTFDEREEDIEMISREDGKETRIIIRKDGTEEGPARKKDIEKKQIRKPGTGASFESGNEHVSLNITVKDKTAKLSYSGSSKEPVNVSVLDETGKQVFYDSRKEGGKYSKDIKLEKKGTYFLTIIHNKKSTTEKIIID